MNFVGLLISGWMIGLIAAVPIGPVNLICIRRTLQCGTWYGFQSGLGAALGDGLFACIAGFSLTALAQLIQGNSTTLQIIGGVMLIAFGLRMYYAPPPSRINDTYGPFPEGAAQYCNGKNGTNGKNGQGSRARGMASTFVLTITNPATLFWFMTWSAGLSGLADHPSFFAASLAVIGVMLGSATWWLMLTTVVGELHARIDDHVVRAINRVSGVLVFVSGLLLLGHVSVVSIEHLFG